jgi:hypothetical protein
VTTARITVYIQALGGKYLGPNAYDTNNINLTLTLDGKPQSITYKYAAGENDGEVAPAFIYEKPPLNPVSSFLPILTPNATTQAAPVVNYLTPNGTTICGRIEVDVTELEMLGTLTASIPRPDSPEPVPDLVLTQGIALNQMQSHYRAIMIVPGLLLEQPPKDKVPKNVNSLFLWVKMMCGCPVTTEISKSFWLESDFTVTAEVFLKSRRQYSQHLAFFSDDYPSVFALPVADLSDVEKAHFTARQKSTGNIGFLVVNY